MMFSNLARRICVNGMSINFFLEILYKINIKRICKCNKREQEYKHEEQLNKALVKSHLEYYIQLSYTLKERFSCPGGAGKVHQIDSLK